MMITYAISAMYHSMMSAGAKFMAALAIHTKLAWASLAYGWLATKTYWMASMFGLSHPILAWLLSAALLVVCVLGAYVVIKGVCRGLLGLFRFGLRKIQKIYESKKEKAIQEPVGLNNQEEVTA